jgi:transposase-like protein
MEKKIRRQHTTEFKIQVVMALLKQDKTVSQVCSEFKIHPTQAKKWKEKVMAGMKSSLSEGGSSSKTTDEDAAHLTDELYRQIGQLKVELDWLKKKMGY